MSNSKSFEELLKSDPVFAEHWAKLPPRKPKPKPAVVATVSEKFAEAVQANPEGVRLSVRAKDDTVVVERPRRSNVVDVIEVEEGRPKLVRTYDAESGHGVDEYKDGYGPSYHPKGGAVHSYNPLDALKGD
jgi:hypothetical protein